MSWVDIESDNVFGPQFKDKFDFTITFEHTILTTAPASLFIAAAPVYFFLYRSAKDVVLPGKLLWLKIASAVALVAIECANLALWSSLPGRNSENAITAATLACVSAICLVPILYLEHRYTLRSTAYMGIWLILTVLCDITRCRSLFLRQDLLNVGILTTIAAILKACLFVLEELSKKSLIKDEQTRNNITTEATSGVFSRILFLWMYRVFSYGFKNIIRPDSLNQLAPTLATQHVTGELAPHWSAKSGCQSSSLASALLQTCKWPFLASMFPQLCATAFVVAQPLLLRSVVLFTGSTEQSASQRNGLILATFFVYGGLVLSKSAYNHVIMRISVRVRGMLLAEISKKSFRLTEPDAKKAGSVSLMNADTQSILYAAGVLHLMWSRCIEIAFNVYILSTIVKQASFLFIIPAILSIITGYIVSKRGPHARKAWLQKVSERVTKTSDVLTQIKLVKMIGLEKVMTRALRRMRETELEYSKKSRFFLVLLLFIGTICDCATKPLVLAGALFWTGLDKHFTPHDIFTALATLSILGIALDGLTNDCYAIQNARACLQRIEAYLALEERTDPRETDVVTFNEHANKSIAAHQTKSTQGQTPARYNLPPERVIEVIHAFIAVQGAESPVLKNITLSIDRGQFAIVVGPTGSGKTTLLKTILGETCLTSGSLFVEPGDNAFCSQTPWIRNASIKDNIIGDSPPDLIWYDAVLVGCELKKDLEQLPDGDQTMTGSNGENLSGGQKQRVALARALFARSSYVILDDVLAALDRATASRIMENMLGDNGLLKRSQSTVILATHSVQFLDMADRIVVVDGDGNLTTATNVTEVIQNDHSKAIIEAIGSKEVSATEDSRVGSNMNGKKADATADDEDVARQQGDTENYFFYARSFKIALLLLFIILIFVVTALENLSDAYMRIWMEVDRNNLLFFIGYALIGSTPGFLQGLATRIWFMNLVPGSAILLHHKLLDVIMRAKLHFLTEKDHGSLLNLFSQDMWLACSDLPLTGFRTLYYFFRMAGNIIVIVAVSRYTGLGIPIIAIAMYFVQLVYLRTSRQLRYLRLEAESPLCAQFTESGAGVQHIRAFGWEHQQLQATFHLIDNSQIPYFLTLGATTWLSLIMDSFTFVAGVVLVAMAVWLSYITSTSGIGLSMVAIISLSLNASLFVSQWMGFETALGSLSRLRGVMQNTPIEEETQTECELPPNWPSKGSIIMEDVVARYNPDSTAAPILDGVSLYIPEKSKVGIVGRTGSGKSSILMALLGFMDYQGTITIDGVNIARVPRQKVREVITTISQGNLIFDGTLRENLFPWSIGLTREQSQMDPFAAGDLIDKLGIMPLLGENQEKLDRNVLEAELSHGQEQLISIARSCLQQISRNTKIIILDEATSSLDKDTEESVLRVLSEVFSECTVLSVAHRTEALAGANLMITMSDGKVASVVNRKIKGVTPSNQAQETTHDERGRWVEEVDVGELRPLRAI